MPDFQRIVDDLRNAVVYSAGATPADVIETHWADYRDACERTNDRLRHCEGLLKKGLRSEAIQYAEIDPNLLDVVAVLDFPERDVVAGALRPLGLVLPQLFAELAGDLNEAYALQQPLDSLLSRHRYLALSGSPLKDRLRVLRKIAEADPGNPIWNEDIAAYEQERIKELHTTAGRAAKARDFESLDACYTELMQSAWQQMPPDALKRSLTKARSDLRRSLAYERLQALEPELNAAHAALDVDLGRTRREAWNAALEVAQPPDNDPLLQRCAPALLWLSERDRRDQEAAAFAQACADLEHALEADTVGQADRVRLESLYHAALRHGCELPAQLESRYHQRIAAWELSATRKMRLRLLVAVAGIAIVAAGVAFGIRSQLASSEIKEAATALTALVTQGKDDPDRLPEAEAFYKKLVELRPHMADVPVIRQLHGEIANAQRKEDERRARFENALARARAHGAGSPDQYALTEAAEAARLDDEKAAVSVFQAEIAHVERERRAARDAAFTGDMEKLTAALDKAEALGFADVDRLLAALDGVRAELDAAQVRHAAVAQSAVLLAPLQKRVAALNDTARRVAAERQALEAVLAAVSTGPAFLTAMQSYREAHAGGRADDFKTALTEAPQWRRLEEWNQAAAAAEKIDNSSAMPAEIGQLKAWVQAFQRFPHVDLFQKLVDRCERLAARRDSSGLSKIVSLRTMFDNQLLRKAWALHTTRGDVYYLLDNPARTPTSQSLTYVVDYALTKKNAILPSADIVDIRPAPHCAMAEAVLVELDRMKRGTEADWEIGFATIIRKIYEARDAEPLLRLGLLKRVVETACSGSATMPSYLQVERNLFASSNANLLVNWMDARSDDAKQAARTAETELGRLVDLPMNADRAAAAAKDAPGIVAALPRYTMVGCLINHPQQGWRCVGAALGKSRSGRLVVMVPNAADGDLLRRVGTVADGQIQLASVDGGFVEGRMVWLEATP